MEKELSFVILTWNSERYIENCLHAVFNVVAARREQVEIFVVDNGSQDATVALLHALQAKHPEQLWPIFLEKNTGTTYSRNLALKQANGEYLCIMDSDVEISAGVLERLIQTLADNPQIGLAVPKLCYPNGHLQKSTDGFPTITTKLVRYFFLKTIEARERKRQQAEGVHEVDYAISAMWLLRREVLETVGFLDEKIFYAPEDVDYCLRIWQAGYTIVYNPNVACIHHTQEISRGLKLNKALLSHIYGLAYYFWKHHYLFRRPKNIGKRRN